MIAFFRVRFATTPAQYQWSDTIARNFLDPSIRFSLAHYWTQSSFFQVQMPNVVFPELVISDPRTNAADDRIVLIQAVFNAAEDAFKPNWSQFKSSLIFFAQPTDLFGGGSHGTPIGTAIPVAVFDNASGFDQTCQELGHAFGLSHETGAWRWDAEGNYSNDYGCLYSVMSAAQNYSFDRAPDERLPGKEGNVHPARITGPYLPAAHLYLQQHRAINPQGAFNQGDTVAYVPTTYQHSWQNVRLHARDAALAAWPVRRTVLAVIPPIVPAGDTYFIELRRPAPDYDRGIPAPALVILSANLFNGNAAVADPGSVRLAYVDDIDLTAPAGDLDFHAFDAHFVMQVVASGGPDFPWVDIRIRGDALAATQNLMLDTLVRKREKIGDEDWRSTNVAPCLLEAPSEFRYRPNYYQTFFVLRAQSQGFEQPAYQWKIDGTPVAPSSSTLIVNVQSQSRTDHALDRPAKHSVRCDLNAVEGRLELLVVGSFAAIVLRLEVQVSEGSASVLKAHYPTQTLTTNLRADNLEIEWESAYRERAEDCLRRMREFNDRFAEMAVPLPGLNDPDPPFFDRVSVRELLQLLLQRQPRAALAVAQIIATRSAVPVANVLAAAQATKPESACNCYCHQSVT